jgi:hypothetical protein
LTLIGTLLDWEDIVLLSEYFCNLLELHVGFNNIYDISVNLNLDCIQSLNLEHNQLSDWACISKLGTLPNLYSLNLGNNKINSIHPPNGLFLKLKTLNVANNLVNSWTCLHTLNDFSNLREIRISGNPICDQVNRSYRTATLVARLKNATRLNGSEINRKTRTDAECYYLTLAHIDINLENFETIHPRYKELCEIHGTPVTAKLETTVSDKLIELQLHKSAGTFICKKIPKQTTIRVFKTIMARLISPSGWQKLLRKNVIWINSMDGPLELSDEMKSLDFLGISEGDKFEFAK